MNWFEILRVIGLVLVWVCVVIDGTLMFVWARRNKRVREKLNLLDMLIADINVTKQRLEDKLMEVSDEGENNNNG